MPPKENKSESKRVPLLRTYSSDLANAVREKGGSVVRIAIAEEEKHHREFEEVSITSKRNIFFMICGVLLLILAIGGIFWMISSKQNPIIIQTTPTNPLNKSLIPSEDTQQININGMQLSDMLSEIEATTTNPVRIGTIKSIAITQSNNGVVSRVPSSQFLNIFHTHAPADFLRSLSNDYMLGIYSYDHNNTFMVLRGTTHDTMLAGMLAWEPYLLSDLQPIIQMADKTDLTPFSNTKIIDSIIENRDARTIVDSNNNPVFFYSFLDPVTVIIATEPKTLIEAVRRY